jgi:hypothetical protein
LCEIGDLALLFDCILDNVPHLADCADVNVIPFGLASGELAVFVRHAQKLDLGPGLLPAL